MPRFLGKTIISSGRGLTEKNRTLDCAFVESATFGSGDANQLPPKRYFTQYGRAITPRDYGIADCFVLSRSLRGFSGIKRGEWYFKVGRTTGLTAGVSNGTEAYVMCNEPRYRLATNGTRVKTEHPGYSEELVIINAALGKAPITCQDAFCDSGDEGALIIDSAGNVAGLMWGETTSACGPIINVRGPTRVGGHYVGAGLVTDIRDVVNSIEARTTTGANPSRLSVLRNTGFTT